MIRLQWNALRVGHHVLVHDEAVHDMPLVPGEVIMLQTAPTSNEVTVRISPPDGPTRVISPRRLAVHLGQLDTAEECWRCVTGANSTPHIRRDVPATPTTE